MAEAKSGWVDVPLEVAQRHALYGAAGWLIFVAIGQVSTPLLIGYDVYTMYRDTNMSAMNEPFRFFIQVEMALNVALAVWALVNLYLLVNLSRHFPPSIVAFFIAVPTVLIGDVVAAKTLAESSGIAMEWDELLDRETIRVIARSIGAAAIWIPYMFISRRVNVTYRHRVRADDPLVAESAA
jgi:hypothetical protein